jgi:hypothetical protein
LLHEEPSDEPLAVEGVEPDLADDRDGVPAAQPSGLDKDDAVAPREPPLAAPLAGQGTNELADEPSVARPIDIVGDPDVPYAPALAPMASNDAPPKSAKGTSTKATGLRRLLIGRKRAG